MAELVRPRRAHDQWALPRIYQQYQFYNSRLAGIWVQGVIHTKAIILKSTSKNIVLFLTMLIKRNIASLVREHLRHPEITVLLGPRQVGKTTLIESLRRELMDQGKRINRLAPTNTQISGNGYHVNKLLFLQLSNRCANLARIKFRS